MVVVYNRAMELNHAKLRETISRELVRYAYELTQTQRNYLECLMAEYVDKQREAGNLLCDVTLTDLNPGYIEYLVHKFTPQVREDFKTKKHLENTTYLELIPTTLQSEVAIRGIITIK